MASPQTENGFTKLANELLDAFCAVSLSGHEWNVIHAIIRKTYGYNKKEDWVTNTQIMKLTGQTQQKVSQAKRKLVEKRIITENGNKISLNKNYEEWLELPKTVTELPKTATKVTENGEHKRKKTISKESKKPSMKKETYIDYKTGEVKEVQRKSNTPRKEVIDLVNLFQTLGEKHVGIKPHVNSGYFKLIKAMKEYSLSTEDVKSLYSYFFKDSKLSDEKKVSFGLCISGAYITQWKVANKNKPVSQLEASSEIYL